MNFRTTRAVVPANMICPISLELMRDPVTLRSGITYDRTSIEKWFEMGHDTCPATMTALQDRTLTSNQELKSSIAEFTALNPAFTSSIIPPPPVRLPPDKHEIESLLEEIRKGRKSRLPELKRLRAIARASTLNSRFILQMGAVPVLAFALSAPQLEELRPQVKDLEACEEAIGILVLLPLDEAARIEIFGSYALKSVCWVLRNSSLQGKINAAILIEILATDKSFQIAIGYVEGIFEGLTMLLREGENQMAVNSAIMALLRICLPTTNRIKATRAGCLAALVEIVSSAEGGVAEHILAMLELLCGCNEARIAVREHALAIPVIVKKIMRVSDTATGYAVGILWAICKHTPREGLREKFGGLGLFGKLIALLRRDMSPLTRIKVCDILEVIYNARLDHSSTPSFR